MKKKMVKKFREIFRNKRKNFKYLKLFSMSKSKKLKHEYLHFLSLSPTTSFSVHLSFSLFVKLVLPESSSH
jgi:hypothetical protein